MIPVTSVTETDPITEVDTDSVTEVVTHTVKEVVTDSDKGVTDSVTELSRTRSRSWSRNPASGGHDRAFSRDLAGRAQHYVAIGAR
jgi:hypothetical protein